MHGLGEVAPAASTRAGRGSPRGGGAWWGSAD
jgi:hypothetical protein